jgi:membrane protease YdiL (CAAX protease family)
MRTLFRHPDTPKWLELTLLFGVLPLLMLTFNQHLDALLIPLIVAAAGFCLYSLLQDKQFKRTKLGWRSKQPNQLTLILHRSLLVIALVWAVSYFLFSEQYLYWLELNYYPWLVVILLYPLFSALPQELIYRTFLFHRYKSILPNKTHRVWLSACAFGFAHIFYANWIAVILSVFAGYIFCQTYLKTKSTLLVALEHSIWGLSLFVFGLGASFDTAML